MNTSMNVRKAIPMNRGPLPGRDLLQAAIAQWQPGRPLPQVFYKDPAIFQYDMRYFVGAHWHCVGHASMVPRPSDFFTVDIGGESIIIVRGPDQQIRALVNVCSHRGSRVCTEAQGSAKADSFQCPYHAWTYDCTGALQRARLTPDDFRKEDYGLKQLALRECEGLLFITFAEKPLGFKHVEASFGRVAKVYGWAKAKVAARRMYRIDANWKLVVENYNECYHCGPAHQEYSRRHAHARPPADRVAADVARAARDAQLGLDLPELMFYAECAEAGEESATCFPSPMVDGYHTGSRSGKPVAPLMGEFKGKGFNGGCSYLDMGPTSNFIAYPDYSVVYRSAPISVDKTGFELIWLVDENAVAGTDYQEEELVWMWDYTSKEDKRIIEYNQAGVNSAYFEPGPYAPMEHEVTRYVRWYIDTLKQAL